MSLQYGITSIQLIPQSDFAAQQNENGGWTANQSFLCKKGALDSPSVAGKFLFGKQLTELDPDADQIYKFLYLSKIRNISTVEGGYTRIDCQFDGYTSASADFDPNEPDPVPTYSKRGVLVDAPLDEHPKWKALADTEKFALGLLIKGDAISSPNFTGVGTYGEDGTWAAWEDDSGPIVLSGDALEFATLIAQGKTTYKMASYEYIHRWESTSGVTTAQMNDLGKISTPSGSPPKPNASRDWMLVGVNEEQHGSSGFRFSNELVYLLSDEGGHDSFLYSS
jgi:hypothetical protein